MAVPTAVRKLLAVLEDELPGLRLGWTSGPPVSDSVTIWTLLQPPEGLGRGRELAIPCGTFSCAWIAGTNFGRAELRRQLRRSIVDRLLDAYLPCRIPSPSPSPRT